MKRQRLPTALRDTYIVCWRLLLLAVERTIWVPKARPASALPGVSGVGQSVPEANVSFPAVPGVLVVQSMRPCLMSRESSLQRRCRFVPSVLGVPWDLSISISDRLLILVAKFSIHT